MDFVKIILLAMGAFFAAIGGVIAAVFTATMGFSVFTLIPLLFVIIGIGLVAGAIGMIVYQNQPRKYGRRYSAKIYGYVENKSLMINNDYAVNTKVHYFDMMGVEREAIIPTSFAKGSNQYPIGMTIDIYEYQGRYAFDKASVRQEILPGEDLLMDNLPVNPAEIRMLAITCNSCGASFEAMEGYTTRCPYCGSYINV